MTLDGSRCHHRRHITAEAHNQWDKRLAVQAHLVHQLIHDEGGTSHVARILHVGDEEVEDKNLRQEHDDGSHTTDDTIDEHILDRTIWHIRADGIT